MSRMDDDLNPAFVVAVAHQVLDHHARGGTCQRCTPTDCDQTIWALAEIAAHHAKRARTTPPQRPAARDGRRSKEHSMKFVKPMRCDNSGPNCVEVGADEQGNRHVRDSKNPAGPVLTFTPAEWTAFEQSVRAGQQF